MTKATVLLADNILESRKAWAETLRGGGYKVVEAWSVKTAKKFLEKGGLDAAVLDLRLTDDDDPADESGLKLAESFHESVPIVMLTAKATVDVVVRALQSYEGTPPAVGFVTKDQGPAIFLRAVRKAIVPKIFLSHGRDKDATAAVKEFFKERGVDVVVLREKSGASSTIIEKFEKHSNVNFAVVLVTPDDTGALRGEAPQPRARQNVILELGFFLAKLGRERVIVLRKNEGSEPIELPSDFHGVQLLEMDSGGSWQGELAREVRDAEIAFRPRHGS